MCHAIEDPTFDATAVATNPRARCRPVHRPPRLPADRVPHCLWEVFIDPTAEPVHEIPLTTRVRASKLAQLPLAPPAADDGGGWNDYAQPFAPDFHLGWLSHAALVCVDRELLVQNHLLVRALMMAVADRADEAMAREIGMAQWIGSAAVASPPAAGGARHRGRRHRGRAEGPPVPSRRSCRATATSGSSASRPIAVA